MYAQIILAEATEDAAAASGDNCAAFSVKSLYLKYADENDDNPTITDTGADPFKCINTWQGDIPEGTRLIIGQLAFGDWVVISEACGQ